MHEESKDQSNEVQAKSERKRLSPHMASFPSNKSYPPHRMNTKHKSDANLPIDGMMHFPALRRLLDVRNSIQSLEVYFLRSRFCLIWILRLVTTFFCGCAVLMISGGSNFGRCCRGGRGRNFSRSSRRSWFSFVTWVCHCYGIFALLATSFSLDTRRSRYNINTLCYQISVTDGIKVTVTT